ncbi:hypothetical protein JW988_03460 [Candidatus Bathyarchaeota archaeon]|nr:hypothetical protein [Candidatus Bathyarchaeota archaeon]
MKNNWKAAVAIAGLAGAGLLVYDHQVNNSWIWERPPFVTSQKLTTDQKIRLEVLRQIARRDALMKQQQKEATATGRYTQTWNQTGQRW